MIGAIADDFTGATDIAVAFRRSGLRVRLIFDVQTTPDKDGAKPTDLTGTDVAVVALKTRTIAAADAVAQSLAALRWLQERGAQQFFFKYCSTFDSTAEGNIGPVADALGDALGATRMIFVPASPGHLRTQYMGHLFVDRVLLSDSPMRHHPLTPMRESYLPAVLQPQTRHRVGLVDARDVRQGVDHFAAALQTAVSSGSPHVLVDAGTDEDLDVIAAACCEDVVVSGAAGLARALGAAHAARQAADGGTERHDGITATTGPADPIEPPDSPEPVVGSTAGTATATAKSVVLAGSCSARTLQQLDHLRHQGHPLLRLDAVQTPDAADLAAQALTWFDQQHSPLSPVVYSSLEPDALRAVQAQLGTERASAILETAMGLTARGLVDRGVQQIVVAGGETSGAVVTALAVSSGVVGREQAPGVPWIHTGGPRPMALLLKSGNFGEVDLLARAAGQSPTSTVGAHDERQER